MSIIDYILIIIISYNIFSGMKKGGGRIIVDSLLISLCLVVGLVYQWPLKEGLSEIVGLSPHKSQWGSTIIVWGLLLMVSRYISLWTKKTICMTKVSGVDWSIGIVSGVIKGYLMTLILFMPWVWNQSAWVQKGMVYKQTALIYNGLRVVGVKTGLIGPEESLSEVVMGIQSKNKLYTNTDKDLEYVTISSDEETVEREEESIPISIEK